MAFRIVVIDDDRDDLEIMEEAIRLVEPGCKCLMFDDSAEALEWLLNESNERAEYILTDINMPKLSGLQVLDELRSKYRIRDVPIIVYSTNMSAEHARNLRDNGATNAFRKPNRFNEYIDLIRVTFRDHPTIVSNNAASNNELF